MTRWAAATILLEVGLLSPGAATQTSAPPSTLSARSAILVDVESGVVLYERNADEVREPASLTKIMTGLLAVEAGGLDRVVTVSQSAADTGEASVHLQAGDRLALGELLEAALLPSANDAAVAVAESVGGSLPAFVQRMNSRAAELGLRRTHFANPSGLPDPSHVSTARDLATLAREALQHPEFRRRVALQEAEMRYERPGQKGWQKRELVTTNRLMRPGHPDYWEAADGIKTGYTKEAGRCLAASATVDGWQLLAVVLGCEDCWRDARQLLQRGFAEYRREAVVVAHTTSATVRVMDGTRPEVKAVAKSSVATIVPRGAALVRPRVIEEYPTAPIRPGEAVGELVVVRSDGTEARATLVAAEAVPRSLGARLRDHAGVLVASVVGLTLLGVLLVHGAVAKAAGPSRSRVASRVRRDGEGRPGHGERPGDPPSGTPGERRTRSGTA